MNPHSKALNSFGRRMSLLLMFRGVLRWLTVWFFAWGVAVLAGRVAGGLDAGQLSLGLLGAIPVAALAALRERRRAPGFRQMRAAYDGLNRCGGLIMAEESAEMSSWHDRLPPPVRPALRWRGGRTLGLLAVSAAFLLVTLLLPDRLTALGASPPLEIGALVQELQAEVETLQQERILEEKKADELQTELARLKEQSSAIDPSKTWEALDHIRESNTDLARRAAEEALSKVSSLAEAETLASALQQASEAGLDQDNATRAAQDLAGMLKAARIEEGLLKGEIPPELLSSLDALNPEDLAKLLNSIQFNKSNLGRGMTNLAKLRLIDAKLLSQCKNAGQCPNPDALAAFLCQGTNGCHSYAEAAISYCRGGLDRGRGDAPMTWKDESTDQGAKFREETLPPSTRLSDSEFVGVSRAAPELSQAGVEVERGALASAPGSGGSAHAQVILPRHRQAVQRYFEREE